MGERELSVFKRAINPEERKAVNRTAVCRHVHGSVHHRAKCASPDERINKMWSTHTLDYYSAMKRSGILGNATTWVDPDIIMLSDTRQPHKDKCHRTTLT